MYRNNIQFVAVHFRCISVFQKWHFQDHWTSGFFRWQVHIQRDPTVGRSLIDVHILLTNLHLKSGKYKVKGFFCCFVFFLQDFGAWVQQIRVLENTNKGRHGLCVIQDGHIKTSSHSASLIPLAGEIQEPPGHFHSGESASITHNSTDTQQSKISTAALFASLAYLELFILSFVQ